MGETQQICRNCRAVVTGEYCSQCGQREGRADRRFLDLAGDITGDLFDWDSRFWRTLFALLFRPGFLTAEFMAGRRARYAPPLRLYLIISFILFLFISMNTGDKLSFGSEQSADPGVVITVDSDEVDGELSEAAGEEVAGAVGEEVADDPNTPDNRIDLADENSPQWLQDLDQRLEGNVLKLKDDPNEFVESLVEYLPQMMFILLPVFALLIRLVYLLSPFHYLQHLVFSLHYHCFVYLLFLIAQLVEYAGMHTDGWLSVLLFIYMPLAFRSAYDSSWKGAIFKSLFVYLSYGVVLFGGFAAVAILAVAML